MVGATRSGPSSGSRREWLQEMLVEQRPELSKAERDEAAETQLRSLSGHDLKLAPVLGGIKGRRQQRIWSLGAAGLEMPT